MNCRALTIIIILSFAMFSPLTLQLAQHAFSSSEAPPVEWSKTYGTMRTDPGTLWTGNWVIQTGDSGFAIASTSDFGTGNEADERFWLVKTDPSGNAEWNKTYGEQRENAAAIVQTIDGGYAMAGNYPIGGYPLACLVKTDSSGTLQWSRNYSETDWAMVYALIQASDGGYVIAGMKDSYDGWLMRTDANGTMLWSRSFVEANSTALMSVVQTSDAGFAAAGATQGSGNTDAYMVKTDADGNITWSAEFSRTAGTNYGRSIVQTFDGGYALCGYTNSFSGDGSYEVWLIKVRGSDPKTWIVDDDGPADFDTIQEAINAASDGDTVFVRNGTYYEHLIINKTLMLVGEDRNATIVDNEYKDPPEMVGSVVIVAADNVKMSGFTIQHCRGGGNAICITDYGNMTFSNNTITGCNEGVRMIYSSGNVVSGNIVQNCYYNTGVGIDYGSNNIVYRNTIIHNHYGISGGIDCHGNTFSENTIINNDIGFGTTSYDNKFFHNSFVNNGVHVIASGINQFDDSYPSGGNYWSNYGGNDAHSGTYQNETGSDGIGDSPYVIDANNRDSYPLMGPYVPFENQTIYIRADGSIDPSGAPIGRVGDIYTLTGGISSVAGGIVVERDNMTLDGAGYTLVGGGNGIGVSLSGRSNVTIENATIKLFEYGIYLWNSTYCDVVGNNLTENGWGIMLFLHSSHNVIRENNITRNAGDGIRNGENGDSSEDSTIINNYIAENNYGIYVGGSSNSTIANNTIEANIGCGIRLDWSSDIDILKNNLTGSYDAITIWNTTNCQVSENSIKGSGCGLFIESASAIDIIQNDVSENAGGVRFVNSTDSSVVNNNFVNNTLQAYSIYSTVTWNSDYPSGGNYWSDCSGRDVFKGAYQNETGSDGIGDSPYTIDANNKDSYPLMKPYPWSEHDIGITYIGRVYSFDLVVPLKIVIGLRFSMNISTFVMNYGNQTETFNVQVYANDTVVGAFANVTLASRQSTILTLRWNTTGLAYGNYTIRAVADNLTGETDTSDNIYVDGKVYVGIAGDINGDGKVDIRDIAYVARRFGATPKDLIWNPNADLNDDEKIDVMDVAVAAKHFGEKNPQF